ncbi:IS200/IS605 family transposase [Salinibacter sp.]|uniref:IS200/IS605 family transposase n=1 Tax=Salinibacter sp. TaxID=2065818 RepID=UPI003D6F380F
MKGEVARRARELIRQTCLGLDVRIEKRQVDKDHVHILEATPPTVSLSDLMKQIKGRSSRKLQQKLADLRNRYWGQHFWARYFCATSGRVTEKQNREYSEGHGRESPDSDFTVEE